MSALETELAGLDTNSPISVSILTQLLDAQSRHLLGEFNKKFGELNDKIEAQKEKITTQAMEITVLKKEKQAVTDECDELQQYSRRNSIRISGIPENSDEDIERDIKDLFESVLKVNVAKGDLCRIHRTGKPRQDEIPRQVLIKFTNYNAQKGY